MMVDIETREIIEPKNKKIGDFYAVSILKALYPNAKVVEIDENSEEGKKLIEEAERDSSKILIGIGKEFNPDLRNYNNTEEGISTLRIVIENELINGNKLLENPTMEAILEVIDYLDTYGLEETAREKGIENQMLVKALMKTIQSLPYSIEIGRVMLEDLRKLNVKEMIEAEKKIIGDLKAKKDEIIEELQNEFILSKEDISKIKTKYEVETARKEKRYIFATYYSNAGKVLGLLFLTINKAPNREELINSIAKEIKENLKEELLKKPNIQRKETNNIQIKTNKKKP
jgi:6-pyruvoyl-tetrahydropterin synthase